MTIQKMFTIFHNFVTRVGGALMVGEEGLALPCLSFARLPSPCTYRLKADTKQGLGVVASGKSINYVFVSTPVRALLTVFCSLKCTE